jgi:hypothetical protein
MQNILAHNVFSVAWFVIPWQKFPSFFEQATNSVCAWQLLQMCRMASCAVTEWSFAHMHFNKLESDFSDA